jgi:nitric oxide reductase NorQ protein
VSMQKVTMSSHDPLFVNICLDVLESKTAFTTQARDRRVAQRKMLLSMIEHHCG